MNLFSSSHKDAVIVYLAGGLGNQIFMLASGWNLAKKNGVPLLVDTSFYVAKKFRGPDLLLASTPAYSLGSESPWGSARLPGGRVLPYPRRLSAARYPPLIDFSLRSTQKELNCTQPSRTLVGYFQSFRFFREVEEDIAVWLNNATFPASSPGRREALTENSFVAIHLRRGDLVNPGPGKKIFPSLDYFLDALALLPPEAQSLPLVVFSDSPHLVRTEIGLHPVFNQLVIDYFEDNELSSVETLVTMSKAQHFILGSSTFGFWAAWLGQLRCPDTTIIFSPESARSFWNRTDTKIEPHYVENQ